MTTTNLTQRATPLLMQPLNHTRRRRRWSEPPLPGEGNPDHHCERCGRLLRGTNRRVCFTCLTGGSPL